MADDRSQELPEMAGLPTEDFLASIGLQPRDVVETASPSVRRKSIIPSGWRRELVQRKIGKTAGKFDIYVYSPDGQKFRSKTELEAFIKKHNLDLRVSDFCFTVRGQHLLDIAANGAHSADSSPKQRKRKREDCSIFDVHLENVNTSLNTSLNGGTTVKRRRKIVWSPSDATSQKTAARKLTPVCQKGTVDKHRSTSDKIQKAGTAGPTASAVKRPTAAKGRGVAKKLLVCMKFSSPSRRTVAHTSRSVNHSGNPHTSDANTTKTLADHVNLSDVSSHSYRRPDISQRRSHCNSTGDNSKPLGPVNRRRASASSSGQLPSLKVPSLKSCSKESLQNHSEKMPDAPLDNDTKWVPPQSPFNLVEESLFYSSWRILIASILLENGQEEKNRKALTRFFELWPSVEDALGATWQQIHKRLKSYDVTEDTAKTLIIFCEEYLTKNWAYPIELHGIKKYGNDAYRIFCINEWKQVAPDNPKLNEYHRWLWSNHRVLGLN